MFFLHPRIMGSVNRFGEISALWHKLKCLWQFYEGLFSIGQKLLPTLVNFAYNWALFHGSKWVNNQNYKSHLVTLIMGVISKTRMAKPHNTDPKE